jgi:hypothetical protein
MDQDSFLREDNGEVGRSSFRGRERRKRKKEREREREREIEWSESKYFNEVSARVVQERMCSKA